MAKTRGNRILRFFDRYLGIALIRTLSLFKKKQPFPKSVKRIGLLKLSGIGDLIVLSGVIKDIKETYPDSDVILFCGAENRAIAPFVAGTSAIEKLNVFNIFESIRTLRSHKLDLLIDAEQWSRIDVIMSFFSKADYTIGFITKDQHRHFLFDVVAEHTPACHEIDNFRKLAHLAAVHSKSGLSLALEPISIEESERPFVVFHPWSISRMKAFKEWPEEHWTELGTALRREGFDILITGGPNDVNQSAQLAEKIGHEIAVGQVSSLAGKTSFKELTGYLKKAHCVISVDTGVMHLAAAVDASLIALFGPTSVHRWGPLSAKAITLSSPDPYMYLGFETLKNPPASMKMIAVEQVIAAFQSLRK